MSATQTTWEIEIAQAQQERAYQTQLQRSAERRARKGTAAMQQGFQAPSGEIIFRLGDMLDAIDDMAGITECGFPNLHDRGLCGCE